MDYKKVRPLFILFFLALFVAPVVAETLTPEESLKKLFPSLLFESVRPSVMKGLYEVTIGSQVLYYSPEAEALLVGEIILKGGRNLTQERKLEIIGQKIKGLPLEKALKIGQGKNIIVEFSDPDCSACRKASEFLSKRDDATRYIFFFPLSEQSEKKIRHILCSGDREAAYKNAYSGKLDDMTLDACKDERVEELFKSHRDIGNRLGIEGTPFFVVNGKIVSGANVPLIKKLLGDS